MATPDPTNSYFEQLTALQKDQAPPTYADISERARELSMLMPQQRKANIYDLATSLSQGLTQQAASGRPSSVGYGLAAGFNLFSEAAQKRRAVADEMQSKLMQMAYSDLEKRKAEGIDLQEKMLDSNFKYDLEVLKQNNGYFQGKSLPAQYLNILVEGESNPAVRETVLYKTARAMLARPTSKFVQGEQGMVEITVPGAPVDELFPKGAASNSPQNVLPSQTGPAAVDSNQNTAPPVSNEVDTGLVDPISGKKIYMRTNSDGSTTPFTKP
tara:strand:+ start:4362 stop:5171 length:810 start_codon:yes stop_codon:yes gene_type:complete